MFRSDLSTIKASRPALFVGVAACLILPVAFAQSTPATPSQPAPAASAQSKTSDAQVEANVLKALAGTSDLANQAITTNTTYGVVTLSGSVATEDLRTKAENIVSRTAGVQKVVDELTLGSASAVAQSDQPAGSQLPTAQGISPSPNDDAAAAQGSPDTDNTAPGSQQPSSSMAAGPSYGPGAPEYRQPYGAPPQQAQNYPQSQDGSAQYPQQQQSYPRSAQQQPYPQYPQQQQQPPYPQAQQQPYPQNQQQPYPSQYPQGQQPYPQQAQQPYPQQQYPQRQPYPQSQQPYPPQAAYSSAPYGGQQPGQMVTVPPGAVLSVRINRPLDSGRTQPGTTFDGIVTTDVVAGGAIAIPRGAVVQGVVVDAKKSGVLAGRGEISLQLTHVTLGGQVYPLTSDVWAHNGGDKATQTVNSTAVGAGLGAVLGAVAGGGAGAAIGAGVGGALGLGSSAASGSGQVFIPAEGLLTFHITQPITVATLPQAELDRLAQGAPVGPGARPLARRRGYPYPYPYYGPVYYRPYYYPYRY